ncbi:rano class II histocompatibility antigen, A beta chain-like isoform X3 [Chanodichthys erythropterus]|uniref:rano class II histocompatibility antigen, A beta chain-like isoform X3 n=1 Tax=Chanodichthys erythropterus TaxID=933992 RepID=UPI00351F45E1
MSLLKQLICLIYLIFTLPVFIGAESANEYYTTRWARCIYSSPDLSDMVYTDSTYFNKYLYIQFNSTIGRFVGFTEHGMRTADDWNNSTYLQQVKERVVFCKFSIASRESTAHVKSVSWLRDGKLMTSEVTSTMEMADGDWYYQIHSELEYTPKSGEKISCMVEHASSTQPMIYDWDPSIPESEKNKITIGASSLVLGIIIAAAGLIYYKKKLAGRILVPN